MIGDPSSLKPERDRKHEFSVISYQNRRKAKLQRQKQCKKKDIEMNYDKNNQDLFKQKDHVSSIQLSQYNDRLGLRIIEFLQAKLNFFKQTSQLGRFAKRQDGLLQQPQYQQVQELNRKKTIVQSCLSQLVKVEQLSLSQPANQKTKRTSHTSNKSNTDNMNRLINLNQVIFRMTDKIIKEFSSQEVGRFKNQNQSQINKAQQKFFLKEVNQRAEKDNEFVFVSPKIQKLANDKKSHINSTNNATSTFESGHGTDRSNLNYNYRHFNLIKEKQVQVKQFQQNRDSLQSAIKKEEHIKKDKGDTENIQNNHQISPIRQVSNYICQQTYNDHQISETQQHNQNQGAQNKQNLHNEIFWKENRDQLQRYFYSFLICLAAESKKEQYFQWVQQLLNQIQINQKEQRQQSRRLLNTQYALDRIIQMLKGKYNSNIKHQKVNFCIEHYDSQHQNDKYFNKKSQNHSFMYFSADQTFLKLVVQFLIVNFGQIYKRLLQFIQNLEKFIEITQKLSNIKKINQNQQNQQTQVFQKYLPDFDDSLEVQDNENFNRAIHNQYFTFNEKQLQNLLFKNKRSVILKKSLLNIFQKAIKKICFNRVRFCRRYEFDAVDRIGYILINTDLYKQNLATSLLNLKAFCNEQVKLQKLQEKAFEKMIKYNLKKIFLAWKQIKIRRQKLLKNIMRRKNKNVQKQKFLFLNKWRLNTRRQSLNQKIMNHSKSCNILITKYSSINCKNSKTNGHNTKSPFQKQCNRKSVSNIKQNYFFQNEQSQIKKVEANKEEGQNIGRNWTRGQDLKQSYCRNYICSSKNYNDKRINDEYQRRVKQRLKRTKRILIKG